MNDENPYYMKGENLPKKIIVDCSTEFSFHVHWYFDAELSTDKMLCEYLCDSDYEGMKTIDEVNEIVRDCFEKGENISNTSIEVFLYLNSR